MTEPITAPTTTGLRFASTIPSSWYFDPQVLEIETREVFGRTWQPVGHVAQIAEPGDYFTATVADEPIVVVRGRDGQVRALSNVCRHRAGPVASGAGSRRSFQCGYHGWSYSLDGRLLATPEFDGVECFRKEDNGLPSFQVAEWNGLLLVNLDPSAEPLDRWFSEVSGRLGERDLRSLKLAARKEWFVDCNWKVYVDNYLEGYHIPIVHPSLYEELDYERYETETMRVASIQHSPIRNARHLKTSGEAGGTEAIYFWVYPNLMLNVYPDNYSTNLIVPLGPGRTLTVFEWYFRDPERERESGDIARTIGFSDEIQLEDIAICETIQRNLRSRTYDRGRYSVKRENGVHHFHELLRADLRI